MKTRSIVKGVAQAVALALLVAFQAQAQQGGPAAPMTVAHLESVQGSVLVGQASGLATGGNGLLLREGTRVITTANGKATVQFDDGCSVRLEPNQRYVVDDDRPCNQRLLLARGIVPQPPLASPQPLLAPAAPTNGGLAGAALSGSLQESAGVLFGGVAGATAIVRWRRDETVSPN